MAKSCWKWSPVEPFPGNWLAVLALDGNWLAMVGHRNATMLDLCTAQIYCADLGQHDGQPYAGHGQQLRCPIKLAGQPWLAMGSGDIIIGRSLS